MGTLVPIWPRQCERVVRWQNGCLFRRKGENGFFVGCWCFWLVPVAVPWCHVPKSLWVFSQLSPQILPCPAPGLRLVSLPRGSRCNDPGKDSGTCCYEGRGFGELPNPNDIRNDSTLRPGGDIPRTINLHAPGRGAERQLGSGINGPVQGVLHN